MFNREKNEHGRKHALSRQAQRGMATAPASKDIAAPDDALSEPGRR
ncbi:hypothetical protein [Affinibrenneria salicis]|nr:hypothetical protein [Affinibrenneria salicis]